MSGRDPGRHAFCTGPPWRRLEAFLLQELLSEIVEELSTVKGGAAFLGTLLCSGLERLRFGLFGASFRGSTEGPHLPVPSSLAPGESRQHAQHVIPQMGTVRSPNALHPVIRNAVIEDARLALCTVIVETTGSTLAVWVTRQAEAAARGAVADLAQGEIDKHALPLLGSSGVHGLRLSIGGCFSLLGSP